MTIFGKIVTGELPCHKVYEDDEFLAFLNIYPKNPGHTLVVPKKAYEDILDIPADLLQKHITVVQKVAKLLVQKLGADGCNIVQNTKEDAGQEIMHIHFHIIPRFKGDSVTWFTSEYEEKDLEGTFKKIIE
jgi:histidine triad (HIT) family protein